MDMFCAWSFGFVSLFTAQIDSYHEQLFSFAIKRLNRPAVNIKYQFVNENSLKKSKNYLITKY